MNWLSPTGDAHPNLNATPVRRSLMNGVCHYLLVFASVAGINSHRQVEATPDAPPPSYSSPHEDAVAASPSPPVHREPKQEPSQEPETAPSTLTVPSVAAVKSAAVDTYDELKAQLARAEATIASLKEQATSGLKQRKPVDSAPNEKSGAPVQGLAQAQRQGTEGVPVHVVAILCLISFLLAYFFF